MGQEMGYGFARRNSGNRLRFLNAAGEYSFINMYNLERRPGFYYMGSSSGGENSGVSPTTDHLNATPFFVGREQTFDMISVSAQSGVASSFIRLGIYSDSTTFPDKLLFDSGDIDTSTSGPKEVPINMKLSGLVWLVSVAHGAGPSAFAGDKGSYCSPTIGSNDPSSNPPGIAYMQAGISGALPVVWGVSNYTTRGSNSIPYIWLKKSINDERKST